MSYKPELERKVGKTIIANREHMVVIWFRYGKPREVLIQAYLFPDNIPQIFEITIQNGHTFPTETLRLQITQHKGQQIVEVLP